MSFQADAKADAAPDQVVRRPRGLDRRQRRGGRRLCVQQADPGPRGRLACCSAAWAWARPWRRRSRATSPTAARCCALFSDSQHVGVRSLMGDYQLPRPRREPLAALQQRAGQHSGHQRCRPAARRRWTPSPPPVARSRGNAYQDYVKVRNEVDGHARPRSHRRRLLRLVGARLSRAAARSALRP